MSTTLDARALERLRKDAKRWLSAIREKNAEAIKRLERILSTVPESVTLRHVQHALARENGFAGWNELKRSADTVARERTADERIADWFLDNACPDHHVRGAAAHVRANATALRILDKHPEVAHHDLYTQIVCGDLSAVTEAIAADRSIVSARNGTASTKRSGSAGDDWLLELGPKGWEPILYLAFTRLALPESVDNAERIADALVKAGADPNVSFMAGASHYTPLVGVIGEGEENRPPHPKRDALIRILLDAGADPFDPQVLYNIHFRGDVLWYLKLIHEHSHLTRADAWSDPEWNMLGLGGYGTGAFFFLNLAIEHSKPELAEWCLAHGASANAAPPPNNRAGATTLYERAVRAGETQIAALLLEVGAQRIRIALSPAERLVAASMRMDRNAASSILDEHPELRDTTDALFAAARRDRADVAQMLFELGISADAEDRNGQRALHVAAYHNALAVARLLIERGAAIDPVNRQYNATPLGAANWARHTEMVDLLAQHSGDVWELNHAGKLDRLGELLAERPELALVTTGEKQTLLMWLPQADESTAVQLARLLIRNGADPRVVNPEGQTAADRAERLGMFRLAEVLRETRSAVVLKAVRIRRRADHSGEITGQDWNDVFDAIGNMDDAELHAPAVMTDAIAEQLAAAGNLTSIVASGSHELTDDGIRALCSIPGLRKLDVSGTRMTDDSMRAIGSMESLEELSLVMTNVSDVGVRELARCRTLGSVNCMWTSTGDELIRSVSHAPGLTRLFTGTEVSGAGLALLHNIGSFVDSTSNAPCSFDLLGNNQGANHLCLRGRFTDDDMGRLRGLDGLSGLDIADGHLAITPRALIPLRNLPRLQWLACEATNESMQYISDLPALRFISCQDTDADDEGFRMLAQSKTIEYIWGRRCYNLERRGFQALSSMPALRGLSVSCKNVDDDGISALPVFPALRELMPMDVPDDGFRHIGQCARLEALLLMYCRDTSDRATEHIMDLSLTRYFASYTQASDRTPELLSAMHTLEDLTFDGCAGVTDAGISALSGLPRLRTLRLSGKLITATVGRFFGPHVRVRYLL